MSKSMLASKACINAIKVYKNTNAIKVLSKQTSPELPDIVTRGNLETLRNFLKWAGRSPRRRTEWGRAERRGGQDGTEGDLKERRETLSNETSKGTRWKVCEPDGMERVKMERRGIKWNGE